MKNELSFGQRITASWRILIEHLNKVFSAITPEEIDRERAEYRQALLTIGRKALLSEYRGEVGRDGCLATIAACIEAGVVQRDDIVRRVLGLSTLSNRMIGYLLGEYTGDDPDLHLWYRDDERNYALLT